MQYKQIIALRTTMDTSIQFINNHFHRTTRNWNVAQHHNYHKRISSHCCNTKAITFPRYKLALDSLSPAVWWCLLAQDLLLIVLGHYRWRLNRHSGDLRPLRNIIQYCVATSLLCQPLGCILSIRYGVQWRLWGFPWKKEGKMEERMEGSCDTSE